MLDYSRGDPPPARHSPAAIAGEARRALGKATALVDAKGGGAARHRVQAGAALRRDAAPGLVLVGAQRAGLVAGALEVEVAAGNAGAGVLRQAAAPQAFRVAALAPRCAGQPTWTGAHCGWGCVRLCPRLRGPGPTPSSWDEAWSKPIPPIQMTLVSHSSSDKACGPSVAPHLPQCPVSGVRIQDRAVTLSIRAAAPWPAVLSRPAAQTIPGHGASQYPLTASPRARWVCECVEGGATTGHFTPPPASPHLLPVQGTAPSSSGWVWPRGPVAWALCTVAAGCLWEPACGGVSQGVLTLYTERPCGSCVYSKRQSWGGRPAGYSRDLVTLLP